MRNLDTDRIHDSVQCYVRHVKLDLDVNGTVNTLERVDFKPVTPAFPGINIMHVEKSFITSEDHGKID